MGWPARAVIIQKPVNRDSGPLPLEVLQGASLEHILGGGKVALRAWQKCGAASRRAQKTGTPLADPTQTTTIRNSYCTSSFALLYQ